MRADADDRLLDRALVEKTSLRDDRLTNGARAHVRRRQEPLVSVRRPSRIVEVEWRVRLREHDVRVVKRFDGTDVGPIPVVEIRAYAMGVQRTGNDLASEIGDCRVLQQI